MPLIVLARQAHKNCDSSDLLEATRQTQFLLLKEQHKFRCLRSFLSLSGDADVPEGQPGAIYDQFVCLFREMAIEYILTGIVFKAELHIFLVMKSGFFVFNF